MKEETTVRRKLLTYSIVLVSAAILVLLAVTFLTKRSPREVILGRLGEQVILHENTIVVYPEYDMTIRADFSGKDSLSSFERQTDPCRNGRIILPQITFVGRTYPTDNLGYKYEDLPFFVEEHGTDCQTYLTVSVHRVDSGCESDECWYNAAIRWKNADNCNRIKGAHTRDTCWAAFAEILRDPLLCDRTSERLGYCKFLDKLNTGNPALCWDADGCGNCGDHLAMTWTGTEYSSLCHVNAALTSGKGPAICNDIEDQDIKKEFCLDDIQAYYTSTPFLHVLSSSPMTIITWVRIAIALIILFLFFFSFVNLLIFCYHLVQARNNPDVKPMVKRALKRAQISFIVAAGIWSAIIVIVRILGIS